VEGTLPEATTEEAPASTLQGDAAAGEEVFASAGCGGCHTLSAAGTNGNVGPNLDEAQPSEEAVATIVTNGRGGMPAFEDQLEEQQIADVAAYVAENAGS
jgi:sulfite dehydrogenase